MTWSKLGFVHRRPSLLDDKFENRLRDFVF
jgi:hypothetical protein